MNAKYFLDSNIIIYLFDSTEPKKMDRCRQLFEEAHSSKNGVISTQVVQEFTNVVTKKFKVPLAFADLQNFIVSGLRPLCTVQVDTHLIIRALRIRDNTGYAFYDALVIAAALQSSCTVLYSEDLQHEQVIETLLISNPFNQN